MHPTPDMLQAAWRALRGNRPGQLLGPGPAFVEAITAALAFIPDLEIGEMDRLNGLVYVPGAWRCPRCNFTLLQSNLNARDGTVTPRDAPGDRCPNCHGPLWRTTYRDDAVEMAKRCEEQMIRAVDAERLLAQAQAALKWMRDRDDRNGSLPEAYRHKIDEALFGAERSNL